MGCYPSFSILQLHLILLLPVIQWIDPLALAVALLVLRAQLLDVLSPGHGSFGCAALSIQLSPRIGVRLVLSCKRLT